MSISWLAQLLQTTDPLFPTGSYAHSFGLEEIVGLGIVHDPKSLERYLLAQVLPALQFRELPYLRFVHEATEAGNFTEIEQLDAEIHGWKTCRETRESSVQQGTQRLCMLSVTFGHHQFKSLENLVRDQRMHGHHLTVFGAQCAIQSIPLKASLTSWLYQVLAGHCTAALKLIRIGQTGCQQLLESSLAHSEEIIQDSLIIKREEAGWFNPLNDIAAARHEFAPTRLFIS